LLGLLLPLVCSGCPEGDAGGPTGKRSGFSQVMSGVHALTQEIVPHLARRSTINGAGLGSETAPLLAEAAQRAPWSGYPEAIPLERLLVYESVRSTALALYREHEALLASAEGSTVERPDWSRLLNAWAELEVGFAQALVDHSMSYAEARYLTQRIYDQFCAAHHEGHQRPGILDLHGPLSALESERIHARHAQLSKLEAPLMDRLLFALGVGDRHVLRSLCLPPTFALATPDGVLPLLKGLLRGAQRRAEDVDAIRGAGLLSDTAPLLAKAREQNPWSAQRPLSKDRLEVFLAIRTREGKKLAELRSILELADQRMFATEADHLVVLGAWAEVKREHARALVELGMSEEEYLSVAARAYDAYYTGVAGEAFEPPGLGAPQLSAAEAALFAAHADEIAVLSDPLLDRLLFRLAPYGAGLALKAATADYPNPRGPGGGWD